MQVATSKTAKKRTKAATTRKRPVQARSQRRLETILVAAAESFADFGFEATTMEGIAARASTSIGSVYQFFPNKRALFRDVALRALESSASTFASVMGPNPLARPWREVLTLTIDAFRELQVRSVFMRAIWRNFDLYGEYAEDDWAQLRGFSDSISVLIGVWAPRLEAQRRSVIASTLVTSVAGAMLTLARESDERADDIVEETKVMLARYLEGYVENDPGSVAG